MMRRFLDVKSRGIGGSSMAPPCRTRSYPLDRRRIPPVRETMAFSRDSTVQDRVTACGRRGSPTTLIAAQSCRCINPSTNKASRRDGSSTLTGPSTIILATNSGHNSPFISGPSPLLCPALRHSLLVSRKITNETRRRFDKVDSALHPSAFYASHSIPQHKFQVRQQNSVGDFELDRSLKRTFAKLSYPRTLIPHITAPSRWQKQQQDMHKRCCLGADEIAKSSYGLVHTGAWSVKSQQSSSADLPRHFLFPGNRCLMSFSSSSSSNGDSNTTNPQKPTASDKVNGVNNTAEKHNNSIEAQTLKTPGDVHNASSTKNPISLPGGGGGGGAVDVVRSRIAQVANRNWHMSDLLTVLLAVTLLTGIVFGPGAIEKMRKSSQGYDEDLVDDDVLNLTRMVKEYSAGGMKGVDEMDGKSVLAAGLSDVLKQVIQNEEIQSSLTALAIRVLQAPEVIQAAQVLVKRLFEDLVNDPTTLDQVVLLLQRIVARNDVQKGAAQLVLLLCDDEDIYAAITKLVVRVSGEEEVIAAVQGLLTESAHKTLTDPEILDHGMEFAADVVGDDVVQRTSGEALWNTISYSVRPAFTSMLYAAGSSLIVISFIALAKARTYVRGAPGGRESGGILGRSRSPSIEASINSAAWSSMATSLIEAPIIASSLTILLTPVRLIKFCGRLTRSTWESAVYVVGTPLRSFRRARRSLSTSFKRIIGMSTSTYKSVVDDVTNGYQQIMSACTSSMHLCWDELWYRRIYSTATPMICNLRNCVSNFFSLWCMRPMFFGKRSVTLWTTTAVTFCGEIATIVQQKSEWFLSALRHDLSLLKSRTEIITGRMVETSAMTCEWLFSFISVIRDIVAGAL